MQTVDGKINILFFNFLIQLLKKLIRLVFELIFSSVKIYNIAEQAIRHIASYQHKPRAARYAPGTATSSNNATAISKSIVASKESEAHAVSGNFTAPGDPDGFPIFGSARDLPS